VPARALVDTGAVAALFNPADRFHARASDWFRDFRGELLTSEAVVAEAAYLLAPSPPMLHAALVWFQRMRAARLMRIDAPADYARLASLIAQYSNLPCDYADAALIELAERTGVVAIATIDQRDFSVYRLRGRKRFRIVLGT
jgi:predicted nucleic acid-binding protein